MLGDPLEFDHLIGIDMNRALGGMSISKSGEVRFTQELVSVCAQ